MSHPDQYGPVTPDEWARKRQHYEEALERFVGFEPGESKLTDDQILTRRAARRNPGGQWEQTCRPVHEQDSHGRMPFTEALRQLKMRPGMADHLEGVDGDGVSDVFLGPPPADLAARMQWQAMHAQLRSDRQARQSRRVRRRAANNESILSHLRSFDPLFPHVKRWIENFIEHLPPKIGRALLAEIEHAPGTFLEMYEALRDHMARKYGLPHEVPTVPSSIGYPPRRASAPNSARMNREAVLPQASSSRRGGSSGASGVRSGREAEIAALVRKFKERKAENGDFMRYLELLDV